MHNCTTYAACRLQRNGYDYPGWTDNAAGWAADAANPSSVGSKAAAVTVDQTPAVGAIAQWNGTSASSYGHVAYVEAVTATYIITTSDSAGTGLGTGRLKIARTSHYMPDNFIHFRDTHVGEIVHWNAGPSKPKAAWRVGSDQKRHWISSESVYECMVSGPNGANGPLEMPASWLDTIAPLDSGSTAPCGGDVNGDGIVNIKDLSIMAGQWEKQPSPIPIPLLGESIAASPSAGALMKAAVTRSVPLMRPAKPAVVARPVQVNGVGDTAGNGSSVTPSVSADGNFVAFSSFAANLVPADENGSTADVFAWNRPAGTIPLASRQSNGTQLTTPGEDAHISPNGRYVAFDSGRDVWVKDLQTSSLLRISQPNANPSAEPDQPVFARGQQGRTSPLPLPGYTRVAAS